MGLDWHRLTMPRLPPTQKTAFDYGVEGSRVIVAVEFDN